MLSIPSDECLNRKFALQSALVLASGESSSFVLRGSILFRPAIVRAALSGKFKEAAEVLHVLRLVDVDPGVRKFRGSDCAVDNASCKEEASTRICPASFHSSLPSPSVPFRTSRRATISLRWSDIALRQWLMALGWDMG